MILVYYSYFLSMFLPLFFLPLLFYSLGSLSGEFFSSPFSFCLVNLACGYLFVFPLFFTRVVFANVGYPVQLLGLTLSCGERLPSEFNGQFNCYRRI